MGLKTQASILFVNYAGYPSSPNSLMPDNGLASLLRKIREQGHRGRIHDLATVATMRRLVPPVLQKRLERVLHTFESASSKATQTKAFLELKILDKLLQAVRVREEKKMTDEIAEMIREGNVDMVAFKLWNGDGFSGPVRMAAGLKRRFPNLKIAAGGPQVKFFKERVFDVTRSFDVLAVGDGEATIAPLAEWVLGRSIAEVPNVYYLKNGRPVFTRAEAVHDMDSLPFPEYSSEFYPAMGGDGKIMIAVVEDRRGCENLCHFCVHPFISGPQPRSKSPGRIAEEFKRAMEIYGISNFRLGGSSSPGQLLLDLARQIEQMGITVNWTAFARFKDALPEQFPYLRRMGLFSLFFGIESGNQLVLDRMNKRVDLDRVREVISASKAAGIFTVGSVIYPAPFDTPETRAETLKFLAEVRPDSVPLQFTGIYPGTEYARHPERYNLEIVYPSRVDRWLASWGLKKKAEYFDPEIVEYIIRYKINLLFPPKYWKPLPWRINGLRHKEFAAETQSMYEALGKEGILRMLTDEEALMAHLAGMDPKQFAHDAFVYGFTGNWEGMANLAQKIKC